MQNNSRHLLPVGILGLGVEKAQISQKMLLVIGGDDIAARRQIIYIGVKFDGCFHGYSLLSEEFLRFAPAIKLSDSW